MKGLIPHPSDDLPALVISDLETSLAKQLEAHGISPGTPMERAAKAAARNTIAALWLHYQDERSRRQQLERQVRDLESRAPRRRIGTQITRGTSPRQEGNDRT